MLLACAHVTLLVSQHCLARSITAGPQLGVPVALKSFEVAYWFTAAIHPRDGIYAAMSRDIFEWCVGCVWQCLWSLVQGVKLSMTPIIHAMLAMRAVQAATCSYVWLTHLTVRWNGLSQRRHSLTAQ